MFCIDYAVNVYQFSRNEFLKSNQVLRIIWLVVKSNAINFASMARLQIILLTISLMFLKLNIQQKLNLAGNNFDSGLNIFRNLKWKIDVVNSFIGNQLLASFLICVAYYCSVPVLIINSEEHISPIMMVIYLAFDTIGWVTAAEYYNSVSYIFSSWLCKMEMHDKLNFNVNIIDWRSSAYAGMTRKITRIERQMEMATVRAELDSLALSSKFFRVTYGFLSTVSTK